MSTPTAPTADSATADALDDILAGLSGHSRNGRYGATTSIERRLLQQSTQPTGVVLFGAGALGSLILKCLGTGYPLIRVVGAVDHAADKVGRRLAELYPDFADAGDVVIRETLGDCLADCRDRARVLYHLTESVPSRIEGQLIDALTAGLHVISASEAMFHPALRYPEFAARIDVAAMAAGVSIMGVGINPGFSFDSVPLLLARATSGVRRIAISRAIDVTGTGPGDIDHVGYGLWPAEFHRQIAAGRIVGHMGMPESIGSVAERLGLEIDRVQEGWDVETAGFAVDSGDQKLGMIEPGRVIGITQTGTGLLGQSAVITMRLLMYYRPERFGIDPADTIDIEGAHHIRASIRPAALSLFGAANTIVNATHDVIAAPPGLRNILDASAGGARRGGFRYEMDPAPTPAGTVRLRKAPA